MSFSQRKRRNPAPVAFDKEQLRKEIAREQKKAARAKIEAMKDAIRAHRSKRQAHAEEAKAACQIGRIEAREKARALKEAAKDEGRRTREAARASCAEKKGAHRKKLEALRGELEAEKRFQRDMRRIERANRKRPGVTPARVKRSESDDEVRQNIPPELIPLFERVKRQIKGSSRMSRTEAFLQYVEEHPREQYAAIEDQTDALIAELERQQRYGVANPGGVRVLIELGKLTELSFMDGGRRRVMRWSLRSAPALAYDDRGKLHVVYGARPTGPASAADVREYARTHWGERGRGDELVGGVVRGGPWRVLGPGVSIVYTTRKGSRELVDWEHEWGEGARGPFTAPTVVAHVCQTRGCPGNGRISLRGGTYRVTDRGIVG